MNRLKSLIVLTTVSASLLISGCRKHDWVTLPSGNDRKCDVVSAYSNVVGDDNTQYLPLLVKTYVPGTYKLTSIFAHFRSLAGGPPYESAATYPVTYEGQKMIVTRQNGETTTFYFDNSGKVTKATETRFNTSWEYRFKSSGGKLSGIDIRNTEYSDPWTAYFTVKYDPAKKNVLEEHRGADVITYTHDLSKKTKGQFLADEQVNDYLLFLQLVKYLNFFPELQSQNVVTGSTYITDQYPGSFKTDYSAHVIDGSGKVVSYRAVKTEIGEDNDITEDAVWDVNWSCLK